MNFYWNLWYGLNYEENYFLCLRFIRIYLLQIKEIKTNRKCASLQWPTGAFEWRIRTELFLWVKYSDDDLAPWKKDRQKEHFFFVLFIFFIIAVTFVYIYIYCTVNLTTIMGYRAPRPGVIVNKLILSINVTDLLRISIYLKFLCLYYRFPYDHRS